MLLHLPQHFANYAMLLHLSQKRLVRNSKSENVATKLLVQKMVERIKIIVIQLKKLNKQSPICGKHLA